MAASKAANGSLTYPSMSRIGSILGSGIWIGYGPGAGGYDDVWCVGTVAGRVTGNGTTVCEKIGGVSDISGSLTAVGTGATG